MEQPQESTPAADEIRSLRVDGLIPRMGEMYLYNCFSDCAEVLAATVLRKVQTGWQENHGFVEFASHSVAEFVLSSYNGELMPNHNNRRFYLSWDTDGYGTRWRWDPVYQQWSFFGYAEHGGMLDAKTVIELYKDCIPVVTEKPSGSAQQYSQAAYPNTLGDSGEAIPNNTENQLVQTKWNGYGHAGSMDSYKRLKRADVDLWNGGNGAGFMFMQNNLMRPHDLNLYHGGQAGYGNYQQPGLYPQPCAYQLPYQQHQTQWTVGSDVRPLGQLTQVPNLQAGYVNYQQHGLYPQEKTLYLCFDEHNSLINCCYVLRTINLSELLACSCEFSSDTEEITKCSYCTSKVKPESRLRQRAWLFASEENPFSCGRVEVIIPARMGCCASGSQIFFSGGIAPLPLQERRFMKRLFLPSGDVYSFEPKSMFWKKHDWSFLKGKPDPLLFEVNGNLYCLTGRPLGFSLDRPTFEVYYSSSGECEALPDPPFYLPELDQNKNDSGRLPGSELSYAIVGTKILISSRHNNESIPNFPIMCFDVNEKEKKWREMTSLFDGKPFPFISRAALVLDLNDGTHDKVMFSVREYHEMYVSRLVVNDDGSIYNSQDSPLLFFNWSYTFFGDLCPLHSKSYSFVDLGNQKVGFVVCGNMGTMARGDTPSLRMVRVLVLVIEYEVTKSRYVRGKLLATRTFEYKCHSAGLRSVDLIGSFVF
ncbi:uncharacterized protein LOC121051064 [Rosa chinensis]|uniref:uncharacterized protein LOC121051064 n=1 Tax=Rosa chinensis TaxID=74649 RepID=UPI001AD91768|nr:uncharacterized protein LOC121051064 [Rosa chinensis]